ncbi:MULTISPECIES: DUF6723 family protein [Paraburkholderia]|uniref:DUF6723 family protein n=1 Tax=Paraburkholderia TaxID=1822464 RepID=UPI0038BA5FE9
MSRPKLVHSEHRRTIPAADSLDHFCTHAGYCMTEHGRYFGTLKVVRKTDGRVIYPFDGAPAIGPFSTAQEARDAAKEYGRTLVSGDVLNPET